MQKQRSNVDRSVTVGRDMKSSIVQTGDQNRATLRLERITLPPADSVDMTQVLTQLRSITQTLDSSDKLKMENAVGDMHAELQKHSPDKNDIGSSLERFLKFAKKAAGYASTVESLKTPVTGAVAWLGSNWHSLLNSVGLSI
jgi:hypothetical protein